MDPRHDQVGFQNLDINSNLDLCGSDGVVDNAVTSLNTDAFANTRYAKSNANSTDL
jgi:hypothetical protein